MMMIEGIPNEAVCFFKRNGHWCAVHGDFINSKESKIGLGETFEDAMTDLQQDEPRAWKELWARDSNVMGEVEWK